MRATIGIPFYNNAATLSDAIRSVFAQTFQDWELLLIDDGSSDDSLAVARSVCDPRVRVISDGINMKLPYRLNQIVELARAEYVARMDADDLMHPERIEHQVQFLDSNPEIDLVDTGMYSISEIGVPVGIRGTTPLDLKPEAVLRQGALLHATIAGRTTWFLRNKYDGEYLRAEDRELWCRTLLHSKFARIRRPLYFYREHYSFNLNSYLQSGRTLRKILRRYGPSLVGNARTTLLVVETYVKALTYCLSTLGNLQSLLIKRRNSALSNSERIEASEVIQTIVETEVCGFAPPR